MTQRDLRGEAAAALPVSVVTGFLGSGKTTLLNCLLSSAGMAETAVLINEFGAIGLDHLLVRKVDEAIVLLNSGCLCCNVRGDMVTAMRDLFLKRVRGEVPEFTRLIIETTGLADPAPILHTLMTDPLIGARYRLDGVIATVDAVNGSGQLDRQPEPVKQVAVADRIVITKGDLVAPDAVEGLKTRLRRLNPAAPILVASEITIVPEDLLNAGLFNAGAKSPDVAAWLKDAAYHGLREHSHAPYDLNRHDDRVSSFVVVFEQPVSWGALVAGLDLLIATQGENLLRIKGIVNAVESETPFIVHGVQHLFHPPVALPQWPDDDRRTRLVFITRDIGRQTVEPVLRAVAAQG